MGARHTAYTQAQGALVIVDDIQAGCGRSGDFFSFEASGIKPDIVCLAKSISGFGLPMSLILLKPEWDVWEPGEHNGTFRGNNYAFVTATATIELFWRDDVFTKQLDKKIRVARKSLDNLVNQHGLRMCGRGLMLGIDFVKGSITSDVQRSCFDQRLIVETCGPHNEILKLLPPLTVTDEEFEQAISIIDKAIVTHKFNIDAN